MRGGGMTAAESAAAETFVRFVQGIITTCASQVFHHWRAVSEDGVTQASRLAHAKKVFDRSAIVDAFHGILMHGRGRRRRALTRIDVIMRLREGREGRAFDVWARQLRRKSYAHSALLLGATKEMITRGVRLKAAIRVWHLVSSRHIGNAVILAAKAVMVRRKLQGGLER